MEKKVVDGLRWIVSILNKLEVPYKIGGGVAANVYGSSRPINDIDISIPGRFFPKILSEVAGYIVAGPKHYSNEKWDCDTLSLNYHGQEIDLTDADTLRMSNKARTEWFSPKERHYTHDPVVRVVEGVAVALFDPRDLIAYKKELGGEHQAVDIAAVEKYLNLQGRTS